MQVQDMCGQPKNATLTEHHTPNDVVLTKGKLSAIAQH